MANIKDVSDSHDRLCPLAQYGNDPTLCPYCPVIAEVRADERREVALDTVAGIVYPDMRAAIEDEVRADEREKIATVLLSLTPMMYGARPFISQTAAVHRVRRGS